MNLKEAQVPLLWVGAAVATAFGIYEKFATKEYVTEVQAPLVELVSELKDEAAQNTKNSGRSLSLTLAEKLQHYSDQLCYDESLTERDIDVLQTTVIPRWQTEYKELTGRDFDIPECAR